MRKYPVILFTFIAVLIIYGFSVEQKNVVPEISITFDDGKTSDLAGYKLEDWHQRILFSLQKHNIHSIMYVAGHNKLTKNGKYVLSTWNNAGHFLANHTLNHPNFNDDKTTLAIYCDELLKNEAVIKPYTNFIKYFRFPYLKEGNSPEKIEGFRSFMKSQGYKNGYVTIDNSDWYIDSRLRKRLTENPSADIEAFKQFYLSHIYDRAVYYDSLSSLLTGRKIKHTLLLHHNLAAALFLDDLLMHFKQKGWKVIDADKALKDPIYETVTQTIPAGESLTWSMAKASGRLAPFMRYPAEGDMYEKHKMDSLGL
ncbi:MAG: polysaccharide deacetylase family protein [Bacteroidia bacterium]|nr:polysaccharide deacetylase family protein [Bacteroidia bacterium]